MSYLERFKKREMVAKKLESIVNKLTAIINAYILILCKWSSKYKAFILDKKVVIAYANYKETKANVIYKFARFLSFPWHWIIIWAWRYLKKKKDKILLDEDGLQVFSGSTGAGKTSVMYAGIERDRILNHKPWYINNTFEKPRTDIKKGIKYRYHTLYKFEDFWSDYKMHKLPNHHKYGGIVIDEIHRILDYRSVMQVSYKEKFNPFRDYAVLVRHYIKKIWASTQMDRIDKQLMQITKYFHEVRIDIGFDYPEWLIESGAFQLKILGWYFKSYTVDTTGNDIIKHLYRDWYFKNEHADFDYYDTYSMRGAYDYLNMAQ